MSEFDFAAWRKSTRSDSGTMGDCVEVAALWRKSSQSEGGTTGDCIELAAVAQAGGAGRRQGCAIGVRDSKNPYGPVLLFAPAEWSTFVARVKSGTCPPA